MRARFQPLDRTIRVGLCIEKYCRFAPNGVGLKGLYYALRAPVGLKIGIRFPYIDKYTEIKMGCVLRASTGLKIGFRFPYTIQPML
jgi:hypothetical protein